ncbi:MAG: leucine-rich repeat domain-containing protein, partial [Bacteroidaceae bacterium]|nr:leucine-rich repeat domain-containing protein [Bacteroidaceae bacterium]
GDGAFYECSGLTSVTIPNSVTSIGGEAFRGCSGLTSVTIGNSVTSIGDAAFYSCKGLTSVTIPNSVTSIGNCAFQYCSGLTSVTIGNSVTSIGGSAFWGCSRMTSVTIPNSVTSIGSNAFWSCYGMTSVTIGNSVTSIENGAFEGCSSLTSVHISDIAAWCNIDFADYYSNPLLCAHHLYFNGEEVKDLVIPNSVTSIGDNAFRNCSCLTSVTIPNSVTSIGNYAFAYCPELLDVYCYAENVPSTASNTFESSPIENATLHVPVVSVESYKATEPWSRFGRNSLLPNLTLTDGEVFDNNIEQEVGTLTYTRTLPNMLWNPLYVPFKIPYEDLEENYEVAYINAMHSYDNDDNGEIDEMVMEIVKVKAGTLKPNHPYLIKAKNEEAKVMNIVQEAVTLYPAEITTLDCSSVYTKFEITGTYQKMTSGELNGSLVISTDGAWKKLSSTSTLKPFRFYLTISSREGSPVEIAEEAMSRVRIRVMGEDDNATGIDEVKTANDEQKSEIYDLSGRRVSAPAKGGVYIIKGKKVIY